MQSERRPEDIAGFFEAMIDEGGLGIEREYFCAEDIQAGQKVDEQLYQSIADGHNYGDKATSEELVEALSYGKGIADGLSWQSSQVEYEDTNGEQASLLFYTDPPSSICGLNEGIFIDNYDSALTMTKPTPSKCGEELLKEVLATPLPVNQREKKLSEFRTIREIFAAKLSAAAQSELQSVWKMHLRERNEKEKDYEYFRCLCAAGREFIFMFNNAKRLRMVVPFAIHLDQTKIQLAYLCWFYRESRSLVTILRRILERCSTKRKYRKKSKLKEEIAAKMRDYEDDDFIIVKHKLDVLSAQKRKLQGRVECAEVRKVTIHIQLHPKIKH